MANQYAVTSISYLAGTDPWVTIVGTVNGVNVTCGCWFSVFQPNAASAIAFEKFVSALMLAAYQIANPTPTAVTPTVSSFSI